MFFGGFVLFPDALVPLLKYCITLRICHGLLTHSLTVRHLCCVHIFTISNTAAIIILVHVFVLTWEYFYSTT